MSLTFKERFNPSSLAEIQKFIKILCAKRISTVKFICSEIVDILRAIHLIHLMCKVYLNKNLTLTELEEKIKIIVGLEQKILNDNCKNIVMNTELENNIRRRHTENSDLENQFFECKECEIDEFFTIVDMVQKADVDILKKQQMSQY
jgi:hypothetical protein